MPEHEPTLDEILKEIESRLHTMVSGETRVRRRDEILAARVRELEEAVQVLGNECHFWRGMIELGTLGTMKAIRDKKFVMKSGKRCPVLDVDANPIARAAVEEAKA